MPFTHLKHLHVYPENFLHYCWLHFLSIQIYSVDGKTYSLFCYYLLGIVTTVCLKALLCLVARVVISEEIIYVVMCCKPKKYIYILSVMGYGLSVLMFFFDVSFSVQ